MRSMSCLVITLLPLIAIPLPARVDDCPATISVTPEEGVVRPGEELLLTLELVGCDEGNPPLRDQEVILKHSGVGRLDRYKARTDAEGRAVVVFQSAEPGLAEVIPESAVDNTVSIPTVAEATVATIRVEEEPGSKRLTQLGVSSVSIGPQYQPDSDDEEWYLGYLWVLSDDLVELNYPKRTLPKARQAKSAICQNGKSYRYGDTRVPPGEARRWTPTGAAGGQRAWSVIEAVFANDQSASLQLMLGSHGELESQWDEEDGSEVEATAVVDFIVDVENPKARDYVLTITPRELQASSSGAAEYSLSLHLSGTGCNRNYSIPWYVNLAGADGSKENRSGRGARLTVNGDRHVQLVARIAAVATAHGSKMSPPFDGDSELKLHLQIAVERREEQR